MRKISLAVLVAVSVFFISGCKNFHDDIMKNDIKRFAYLQDTASVKKRYTSDDWTPLMSAAYVNDLALAKALIKMPAFIDIDSLNAKGQSALYIAAMRRSYDVFKYLIHVGAKLDPQALNEIKKDTVLQKIASEREEYAVLNENSSFDLFVKFFNSHPKGYYSSQAFEKFLPVLQAKIAQIEESGSLKEIGGFIKKSKQLKKSLKSRDYIALKKSIRGLLKKEYLLHTNMEFKKIFKKPSAEKLDKFLSETVFIEETVEIKEKAELLLVDMILKEAQMNVKKALSAEQQNRSLNNLEKFIKKYEDSEEEETKEQVAIFRKLYKAILLKSL